MTYSCVIFIEPVALRFDDVGSETLIVWVTLVSFAVYFTVEPFS